MSERTASDLIVHRVLIVEDDRQEADFLRTFFAERRMTAEIARDAGQAHSAFAMHQPDVVLLDLILPNEVSGFEVCERMKRENRSVPVIILTAIDRDDSRDLASRVGADAYVTKPYDPDELIQVIMQTAEKAWKQRRDTPEESPTTQVRFTCTGCGKKLKGSASHRGRVTNCPRCSQSVVVPLFG